MSAEGHFNTPPVEDQTSNCGVAVGEGLTESDSTFSSGLVDADSSSVGGHKNHLQNEPDSTPVTGGGKEKAAFGDFGIREIQKRRPISNARCALLEAIKKINEIAEEMDLSRNIVDMASKLFNMVHDNKTLKVRSVDTVASACLYVTLQQEGAPRSFKEICAVAKIPKKEMSISFQVLQKVLKTSYELITTGDFMSRFCTSLGLPTDVQKAAVVIAKTAVELELVFGRSPISVAAAAVYMASLASPPPLKRSARHIAALAGLPENTVKQVYREIYPRAGELFPHDFKFATPISLLPLA